MKDITETMTFTTEEIRRENIKMILREVSDALEERGYNSENQIAGYLISNDPAYISSHKNIWINNGSYHWFRSWFENVWCIDL